MQYSKGRVQSTTPLWTMGAMWNDRIWCWPLSSPKEATSFSACDITSTLAHFILPGTRIITDLQGTEDNDYKDFAVSNNRYTAAQIKNNTKTVFPFGRPNTLLNFRIVIMTKRMTKGTQIMKMTRHPRGSMIKAWWHFGSAQSTHFVQNV